MHTLVDVVGLCRFFVRLGLFPWEVVVDVSGLFGEVVSGIEGIAIGVVVLVLDATIWLLLLIVHLTAVYRLELWVVQGQICDERCGDGAFSDEIFGHVANARLSAKDVVSSEAVH
jgi:hypothetical protein